MSDSARTSEFSLTAWFRRELLPLLADLRLAIVLLLVIAIASTIGTVIEQGETLDFYRANYPEDPALFGFLSWKVLLGLGLDRVYKTWWFLALLILFGSSLTACTFTRQLPALKAARQWKFYKKPRQFQKLALSTELESGEISQLESLLQKQNYKVFKEGDSLYARKGIIGRIGPIVVHASMLLILGGAIWGTMTGVMAQEMIPSGTTTPVKNFIDFGGWASLDRFRGWELQVNRFWIDYTPDGTINQFYSDLSVVDENGEEIDRKTIFVNEPLRYNGVVFYQTDWSISNVKIRLNNSPIFQLPMAKLDTGGNGRIWGTWIPTKPDLSEGVSLLARDLQGTALVYDTEGQLVSSVRVGGETEVNGVTLKLIDIVGATGLQIKSDPGIPLVYLGFGLLMVSALMSYASHSQVWALQQDGKLYVGGRTNRAQVVFERELLEAIEKLEPDTKEEVTVS
ncbi:cytochrome c biogenesis protein [Baaleninema sp.]|uniref:cytochrome c biogenesis protein n=1 Tax=Baaleninema sp. TaxID=3101197 RepID=UPI003CFBF1F8